MQQKSREQENHLAEITRLLSLYQALTLAQLENYIRSCPKKSWLHCCGGLKKRTAPS